MKLTAAREDFLTPLQSVIGVVERRQTMPILANVLLSVRENRLSMTGSDLEVELVALTSGEQSAIRRCDDSRTQAAGYFPRAAGKNGGSRSAPKAIA